MKKCCILFVSVALCFLFTGCSKIMKAQTNSVYLDKDGAVTEAIIEKFDKAYYSEKELTDSITSAVEAYNSSAGEERIEVRDTKIKDDTAKVFLTYSDWQTYAGFNEVDFYFGELKKAKSEGFDQDVPLISADGSEDTSISALLKSDTQYQVVIATEPLQIETARNIDYISKNMKLEEDRIAKPASSASADETTEGEKNLLVVIYEE